MRPTTRLRVLDRLDVVLRRFGSILLSEPLIDDNGRHHPALRSGAVARASARLGDRWYTLRHLFARPDEKGKRSGDVSGVAFAPQAPETPPVKTRSPGRNAAA